MNFDTKYILFTGAGFTKNFGGFLASEMWAQIFNQKIIQSNKKVRNLMLNVNLKFDFEMIYRIIMDHEDYKAEEKSAIQLALKIAFSTLDSNIVERNDNMGVSVHDVNSFINLSNRNQKVCFFFTINQDLFIERSHRNGLHKCPGIRLTKFRQKPWVPLREMGYGELPSQEEINKNQRNYLSKNFFYIKLHGSQDWMGPDGMVIGGGKKEQIDKVPILKWYFEIFENVLYQQNRRLLIIGYGFRDEHINKILTKAVQDYGLNIYIISSHMPKEFMNIMLLGNAMEIWGGLSGYYPYYLKDIFPQGEGPTKISRDLEEQFFA